MGQTYKATFSFEVSLVYVYNHFTIQKLAAPYLSQSEGLLQANFVARQSTDSQWILFGFCSMAPVKFSSRCVGRDTS